MDLAVPPRPKTLKIRGGQSDSSARILSYKIWEAIIQGKAGGHPADIKMMWVLGSNPVNQMPDTNKCHQAFKKLEFVLVHEQYMSATAKFADILLPVNTWMEREDYAAPWLGAPYYAYANKAIDPLGESRSDLEICTELAARLGIQGFNDKTEEEWLRHLIAEMPDIPDYDEFKRKGIHKVQLAEPFVAFKAQIEDPENNPFATPSGKIEIYSQTLADMNDPKIPPIPKYFDAEENWNQPLARRYPLQFISTHFRRRVHAQYDNLPWLRRVEPQALWINPVDAQPRGIKDGDLVKVFNDRGVVMTPAWVTERIMPGVVHLAEGGNYHPDEQGIDRGGNPNVLTSSEPSPLGSNVDNSCLVEVQRA
ncbi:MAG TPA: molybdopterin-dependent oxidoreductase [Dehalococcoidia bacterium]|nr:molybdopterin-dependent oxidoreductase [Dehalococcoidia bacterium]